MPRKPSAADMDNAVRDYVAGEGCEEVARRYHTAPKTLREILRGRGLWRLPAELMRVRLESQRRRTLISTTDKQMAGLYATGISEKAVAEKFGVSRNLVRRRLLRQGIQPRDQSASMYLRMAQMTAAERSQLAAASHEAVRGRVVSLAEKERHALGVQRTLGNVSPGERFLVAMLKERGVDNLIQQKAIGPYNVDIAAGTVAVEVLGGGWHNSKPHGKRLRYLLDRGWDVIYIWVDGLWSPLGSGAAEYVVAHLQFRQSHPATRRCYRVIRGSGELVTAGEFDGGDVPDVVPISSRPNLPPGEVPWGFCHCGCNQRTPIADRTVGQRVKGQPTLYISGHNNSRRSK